MTAEPERLPMSDAEQAVMKVLWDRGPMGVKDVLGAFTEAGQEWSRSTVITLLQRLEKKGYVSCDKSQHAFVFEPAVSREDEMRARMNDLASELCDGEPLPLVLAVVRVTLPPLQKLVALCGVITGVVPFPTVTVMALEVAEQPLLVTVRV